MQLPEERVPTCKHSLRVNHGSHGNEGTQAPRVSRTMAGGLPAVTGPKQLMHQLIHDGQAIQSINPRIAWQSLLMRKAANGPLSATTNNLHLTVYLIRWNSDQP